MEKKFYNAMMICISLMLIMSMTFVFTGCSNSSEKSSESAEAEQNAAAEETEIVQESAGSGQTYDFPQCGFGFELPENVKLTKGFIEAKDIGEIKYNGGLSYAYPLYWDCTEEEFKNQTDADVGKSVAGGSFTIICAGGGRDLETMKKDFTEQIIQESGEISEEQIAFLNQFKLLHQEGEYTWFYAMVPKADNLPEGYPEEFSAFYDATDEILKNMKFYEPQIWRGSEDGTVINFETTDLDGNAVKSEELFSQSKITLINIWGTYCGPCIEEMPGLEELYKDYAEKGVNVVGVVGDVTVSNDKKLQAAKDIVGENGITFTNLRAWDGYKDQLACRATPTTYFIDNQGRLIGDPVLGANVLKYRKSLDELLETLQ